MNIKLDASVVLALTLGCFALSANAKVKYTPEVTNNWFTVSSIGTAPAVDGSVGSNGKWIAIPADGDFKIVSGTKVEIDTDTGYPLVFTNTNESASQPVYRIETTLKITLSSELPSVDSLTGAKTAICVCTNGVDGTTNWWAYINSEWRMLQEADLAAASVIDRECVIALDSDINARKLRFLAKADGEYQELTDGWVENSASSELITTLSFAGYTEIAAFSGIGVSATYGIGETTYGTFAAAVAAARSAGNGTVMTPVKIGGVDVASANIPFAWMDANMNDVTDEEELNANGANGIPLWQSYVLGYEKVTADSKPVVQPEQDASADVVSFSIGNVEVNREAGVPVKYRVNTYANPNDPTPTAEGVFVDESVSKATADLPPSNVGVMYYKMEIKFGE